jgi:hypothetical protein
MPHRIKPIDQRMESLAIRAKRPAEHWIASFAPKFFAYVCRVAYGTAISRNDILCARQQAPRSFLRISGGGCRA